MLPPFLARTDSTYAKSRATDPPTDRSNHVSDQTSKVDIKFDHISIVDAFLCCILAVGTFDPQTSSGFSNGTSEDDGHADDLPTYILETIDDRVKSCFRLRAP